MRKEIEYHTDIGTILNALNVKNIPKLRFVYGGNRMIDAFENMVSPILKQRQGKRDTESFVIPTPQHPSSQTPLRGNRPESGGLMVNYG